MEWVVRECDINWRLPGMRRRLKLSACDAACDAVGLKPYKTVEATRANRKSMVRGGGAAVS